MDWKTLSTKNIKEDYKRLIKRRCCICNSKSKTAFCQHCHNLCKKNKKCCLHCKRPTHKENTLCGQCQTSPPNYQRCIAPYRFEGIIKTLIHHIKFNKKNHYIHPLSDLLSEHLIEAYSSDSWPDQIIYVPSHPKRIKERGFYQTKFMTKHLVKSLRRKMENSDLFQLFSNPIIKLKNTQAQHSLTRKERLKSQRNNYAINKPIAKHVALFDDVMTTGRTIENCTELLLKAGAERVDIWVIARTPDKTYT